MNTLSVSRRIARAASVLVVALSIAGVASAAPGDADPLRRGYGGMMGGGMMGGGMMGGGMMGGGMMGGGMMGGGMMGGLGIPGAGRIGMEEVEASLGDYMRRNRLSDLVIGEVMEFDLNYYAQLREADSGTGAFELLIDPYTGYVSPEPGPNMMWNSEYGHMRPWRFGSADAMDVSDIEALGLAREYLDGFDGGLVADDHADEFHGYYTLHVLDGDEIVGMLSVNGFDGRVWYHDWHGEYRGGFEGTHE